MKRILKYRISGLLAACLILTAARGAEATPAAVRMGDRLYVKLTLAPDARLSANEQLTITPVVINGQKRMQLAPVVFTGRIREKVNQRRERLYGWPAVSDGVFRQVVVRNRKQTPENEVLFEGNIPYESWMAGGRVVLYRDVDGCGGHRASLSPLIAAEIAAPVQPRLSFVVPARDEAKRRSEQIVAVVHFPQGRSQLLRDFGDNRRQLARIDSLTLRLTGNDSLSVENIYLKGYASPEDTYAYNTRLSANRVRSIRNYLEENFGFDDAVFTIATQPEDWDSLRRWVVRCDLPARDEVLAVIDTVSDPDARDAGIRKIDNGKTYYKLLHEVYPQLRRVDYRIAYLLPAFTVEQSRELIESHPEWLDLGEMCRLAESYPLDSPERAYVCAVAQEYYPDDPSACNNMAMLALRRGDVQTARRYLDRCGDDPLAQNNAGVLCLIDGDREKARQCFAAAAAKGSQEAAYNLAHLDELVCEW